MKKFSISIILLASLLSACTSTRSDVTGVSAQSPGQPAVQSVYETRKNHDPDGIGKFYLGREIAHVMGHQGADWLERPDRAQTELPQLVVEKMKLRPTDVVADIGAGTGYFTFRISPVVSQGKVYAVDIQLEMLALLEQRKKKLKAENVITVLGAETETNLPVESVDAVLLVDAYHEFSYPREMMENIFKILKPGGRVIQIEYRGEDPEVPIKNLHKMTVAQARREMSAVGLVWRETKDFLPQQHFLVFEKPKQK